MGVVIVLLMVLAPFASKGVERAIIGSTTVIAAVIGIAAKDVIGDMIAGLQISVHKPFDLGDRIQLEDGTTGIVKSINLRSVTISGLDSLCFEIPNRRINDMILLNYSYGEIPRSLKFEYPVAYDTDINKAKKIIREAVDKSPYSIEIDQPESDLPDFGTVYFLSIESSAIILGVLVFVYNFILTRTVFGRHVYAVGGNRKAAILSGINTKRVDFTLFVHMGFLSAIAAVCVLSRLSSATAQAGMEFEMDAIAACFIGGTAVTGVDTAVVKTIKGLVLLDAVAVDILSKRKKS